MTILYASCIDSLIMPKPKTCNPILISISLEGVVPVTSFKIDWVYFSAWPFCLLYLLVLIVQQMYSVTCANLVELPI
jgi:hypothetical protein